MNHIIKEILETLKMKTFWIIFIGMLLIGVLFLGIPYYQATKRWDEICGEYELPRRCTPIQICTIDCYNLNNSYYKYEGGGLFEGSNCFCKKDNQIMQIW